MQMTQKLESLPVFRMKESQIAVPSRQRDPFKSLQWARPGVNLSVGHYGQFPFWILLIRWNCKIDSEGGYPQLLYQNVSNQKASPQALGSERYSIDEDIHHFLDTWLCMALPIIQMGNPKCPTDPMSSLVYMKFSPGCWFCLPNTISWNAYAHIWPVCIFSFLPCQQAS